MNLAQSRLLYGNETSCKNKLNVIFTQVPIQTKTFLKNMIEIKVLIQF